MREHVARAEIEIDAPPTRVWEALTYPDEVERYMFGARVRTDWRPGSSITWTGSFEGRTFVDKGEILQVVPGKLLMMTHFSPLSGKDDVAENYHTVTYELEARNGGTHVSLTQDNNASAEAADHSRENWERVLSGLKDVVEG